MPCQLFLPERAQETLILEINKESSLETRWSCGYVKEVSLMTNRRERGRDRYFIFTPTLMPVFLCREGEVDPDF